MHILFCSEGPHYSAPNPSNSPRPLENVTILGVYPSLAEATSELHELYSANPPSVFLGPQWRLAYKGPHLLTIGQGPGERALGMGYQFLTQQCTLKTMWVQSVQWPGFEGEKSTTTIQGRRGETEETGSTCFRDDLISLKWQPIG